MAEEKNVDPRYERLKNLALLGVLMVSVGSLGIKYGDLEISDDRGLFSWDFLMALGGYILVVLGWVTMIIFGRKAVKITSTPVATSDIRTGFVMVGIGVVFSGSMIWLFGFPKSIGEADFLFGGLIFGLLGVCWIVLGRRKRAREAAADDPPPTDSESTEPEDE